MTKFNAKAARAKRPCPLWFDAFLRDTQHLEAEEVGGYLLILMAMWTREGCDFPDDDTRLARVARVSMRSWKSRVGPVLREFFRAEDGVLISAWLQEAAQRVEARVSCDERQPIPAAIRRAIREASKCAYCGDTGGPFEIDHVVPVAKGGGSEPDNLALACKPCNRSKGKKSLGEWLQ